jgi:hypothetical protein
MVTPDDAAGSFSHTTRFKNNIFLRRTSSVSEQLEAGVYSLNGSRVAMQQMVMQPGTNNVAINVPSSLSAGMYLLVIKNIRGEDIYHAKVVRD